MYNLFSQRTEKRLKGSLNKCTIWEFWLELHLKTERKKKKKDSQKHCYMKLCCELNCFFHFFLSIYHLVSTWSEDTMHSKRSNQDEDSNIKQDAKEVSRSRADDTLKAVHPHHNGCWWPRKRYEEWSRIYYQKQKQIYQGPKEASASGLSSDQATGVSVSCRKF